MKERLRNYAKTWDVKRRRDCEDGVKGGKVPAISSLSPYNAWGIRNAIRIFFLLTALMMSSQAMAAGYGANLVLNGDAETNSIANWTNSGSVFVALSPSAVGVSNSPSGGYAFDYYPGSASGNESLSQIIDITDLAADITAGIVKAVLSGEVKKFYASSNCILRVQELDASNALLHTSEIDGNTSGDAWVTDTVTIPNLDTNTRKLNVILYAQVSTNTDDYIEFDNIQLVLYRPPTLTTTTVTIYGATSATLGGNVAADGGTAVTERGVVYSSTDATPTIGEAGVTQDTNGIGSGTFSESIASLSPNTTYYVQAYATNSVGTSYGGVVSFTTSSAITSVSVPSSGTYINGQNLDFTVNFSAAVTVVTTGGTPSLPLTIGGVAKQATYVSGSGTTALVFRYTLASGDAGALATGTGITLNGGTIKDDVGNNATLTFTAPTISGITIDATMPSISSVSPPISGTYISGQNLDFMVGFSEPVNVDITNGTPYMALTVGSKSVHADYQSGSGTNSLVFRYVVAANDYDADGVGLTIGLSLAGGTIKDIAGNPAFLIAGPAVVANGVNVDAVLPTISSVTPPTNDTYLAGQHLDFTVNFSEAVTVVTTGGTPYITLTVGSTAVHAAYVSGSDTTALVFRYTVATNDLDTDGIAVNANVTANGGTIKDAIGNAAALTFTGASVPGVKVDAIAPTISISTPSVTDTISDPVDYTITYTGADTVTLAEGNITLNTTGTATGTVSVSGSGTASRTVTISGISGSGTIGISIAVGTASDTAGNTAPAAGPSGTFIVCTGTITVANNNDSSAGSLRQAIADICPGGTIDFGSGGTGAINLTTGSLMIDRNMTIAGPGVSNLTVAANGNVPAFDIADVTTDVRIQDLTITNVTPATGGGISNQGVLTVSNSTITGNSVGMVSVGSLTVSNSTVANNNLGILSMGILAIHGSTVSGNVLGLQTIMGVGEITDSTFINNADPAGGPGGGIEDIGSTLTISGSTFTGNTGGGQGGGILNFGGTLTVSNCTFVGNYAAATGQSQGGAIYNVGDVTLLSCTIAGNTSTEGAAVYNIGTVTITNSILAGITSDNCYGPITDGGNNIDDVNSCGFIPALGSMINTPPLLDPAMLQDNGGPTFTLALLSDSPAIDKGNCTAGPAADQRGIARPQGSACDIGAYERGVPAAVTATGGTPQSTAIGTAFATPLTAGVTDSLGGVLDGMSVVFAGPGSGADIAAGGSVNTDTSGIASFSATANATAGSYTVTATVGALTANFSLTNDKAGQAIVFDPAPTVVVDGTGTVSASGGASGNAVTFSTTTPGCSVSGSTVTGLLAGANNCTIDANQPGNADYNAAPQVSQTFSIGKGTPTVTVTVGTYTYNGSPQGPVVADLNKGGSTGAVTMSYSGTGGTVYGPSATLPTAAGSYTANATVAADSNYVLASSGATAFSIGTATPTVTVTVGTYTYNGSAQGPVAANVNKGGSTGAVTISYSGTGATIYGPSVTLPTAAGSYTATATLAADSNYVLASSGATAFSIGKAATTTTITSHTPDPSAVGQAVTVSYDVAAIIRSGVVNSNGLPLTGNVTVSDGVDSCTATVSTGLCNIILTTPETRTLTATYIGDANFNGSSATTSHTTFLKTVTIPAATGNGNITLTTDSPGCGFASYSAKTEAQVGNDASYDYPYGLVEFTLNCASADVTITFPGSIGGSTYRKYGPTTPGNAATTAWYTFNNVTINNSTSITLHLTDGQLGDDTEVDGIIVDQGGPGLPPGGAVAVPTMNEWGMIFFMLCAGLGAVYRIRRRRA